MTDRLVQAVRSVDPDVTADEIADAVWLVNTVRGMSQPTLPESPELLPDAVAEPVPERPPSTAGKAIETAPESPVPVPEPPARQSPSGDGEPALELLLPPHDRLLDSPGREPVRSPGVAALPGTLALARALRPLRRRMPSRTDVQLDQEATVRASAESELLLPAWRPAMDRWLDVALVVDDSPSMVIWRRTAAELRDLLEHMGAFRDVRVWRCDTDEAAREKLKLRPEGEPDGTAARHPRELIDPTGRRVVLLVSDCVGRGWATGAITDALRAWAKAGPVSIIQPLPQRLWDGCAAELVPVRLTARRPVAPNSELEVLVDDGSEEAAAGVPVPVLELEARWFAPWASLVAATGPQWISGTAFFTGTAPRGPAAPPPSAESDIVEQFFDFASTEAARLAVYLAGAPLSLPVMRLVQQAMLPGSRPSILAEVFLGGLLRRRESRLDRRLHPDDVEYEFVGGIRNRLLASLPKSDAVAVLTKVSDFISARLGSPLDFRAFLAVDDAAVALLERDRPFGRVALQVLLSMGGRYRDAAERLSRRMHTMPDISGLKMTRPPEGGTMTGSRPVSALVHSSGDSESVREDTPSLVLAEPTDGRPAIFGGVPHRNPHFTGRVSMLERLNATLREGTSRTALIPHALHGLGGVGKTQLAIEYVYRYQGQYDLVWWVPAESVTLVRASLVELAREMGLPVGAEVSQTVAMVLQALRIGKPHKRWLLVFDNAGDPQVIRPYLPVPAGHVLITSRDKRWAGVAVDIEIDVFTRAESVELLQRRGHDMAAADAEVLADRLGDLPLALEQAAAWQAETGMSVSNFIHRFDERMNQLLGDSPPGYQDSVVATWSLSFDRLLEDSPAAAQLLQLAAFFGAEPISVAMLRDGRHAALPSPISQVLHDEIPLRRAIRDIGRYALARIDTRRDQIQIHRLVQAVLRDRLDPEAQEKIRDQVHAIMAAALPPDPDNQKYWERHAEFQGHVNKSGIIDAKTDEARRVALDQIRYRYVRGDYERSRDLGETVARRWRETLGPDYELTLIAERHLANTLRALGERKRARELNQQTYATMQRVFGQDHEHTLATANSVGADLRIAGEFQAARAFDVENLERHQRVFGADDTNTLRTMNNLAVSLRLVGEYDEALRIDKAVLDGYLRWAGPTDPRTYSSISSVARDNFDRGKYTTARAVLEESLPNMRANLGDNGLWTLVSIRILAMALRRLGFLARARQLAEEAYQTFRLLYTPTHEHVLSATVGYANILREVGERDQAETLIDGALRDYRAEFGAEHPFALATAVDRAVTLRALGKYAEALAQDEETQPMLRQSLGEDHPYTIKATINLANDYALTHDHQRARELSEMAYSISTSARGDDHPETLAAGLNSALDMLATGDRAPAAALLDEIQERYLQVYEREFPSTRIALDGHRIEQDIELPST